MTSPSEPASYCIECDAQPGHCDHHARRYLNDITYIRGEHGGWKIPNHEKPRWQNHDQIRSEGNWPTPNEHPTPPLLRDVMHKLERTVFLTDQLQALVKDAYLENPTQTSLLVDEIASAQSRGKLTNAGGLLVTRLRKLLGSPA